MRLRCTKKKNIFKQEIKTIKHLHITLISTMGIEHNEPSIGLIDQYLNLDHLFAPWRKEG